MYDFHHLILHQFHIPRIAENIQMEFDQKKCMKPKIR